MTTLCLVGCCKTKLSRAAPAQDLYCSPLFQLCRQWAERHADAWAILSAHYGVVRPDEVIEPYDTTIAQRRPFGQPPLSTRDFGNWLYGSVQAWRCRYAVSPTQAAPLIILAGKTYWGLLADRLKFQVPLNGLGIEARLRWLKEQADVGHNLTRKHPEQGMLFPDESSTSLSASAVGTSCSTTTGNTPGPNHP